MGQGRRRSAVEASSVVMNINCEQPGDVPLGLNGRFTFDYGIGSRPLRGVFHRGSEPDSRPVTRELTPAVTGAQLLQMVAKDYREIHKSDLACEWIQIDERARTVTLVLKPGAPRTDPRGKGVKGV